MTQKTKWTGAFRAGFIACAVAVASIISFAAHLGLKAFRPKLEETAINTVKTWVTETFIEEDLFPEPVYVTQFYKDGRDGHTYQTWKLTLSGRSRVHGDIEDISNGNKGVVSGYWRSETLDLSYASAASDRPGFGSFILRPIRPGLADKSVTYAGLALVHECECKDGTVAPGPILLIPAAISSDRVLPQNIAEKIFTKGPVEPSIVWPADIQKMAANQKH
jgi:hypothetical protein